MTKQERAKMKPQTETAAFAIAEAAVERVYETNDSEPCVEEYHRRHGVESMLILTVHSLYAAEKEVERLRPKITGKVVVEIGAGVGMLAMVMARHAKRVYAIEADPTWSWIFTKFLYEMKPPNLTWIFGKAEEVAAFVKADIAVVYTRSATAKMRAIAKRMAPVAIVGPLCGLEETLRPEELAQLPELLKHIDQFTVESRRGMLGRSVRELSEKATT